MKKLFAAALLLFAAELWAETVEISFDYQRIRGPASNQFAVWVEDAAGGYVKTIYAARFTAQGGYLLRENSLPAWVKKSGLVGMGKVDVDAFSGATPRPGHLVYVWDGSDRHGAAVPPGSYRIVLEATLLNDNHVVYQTVVTLGDGPKERVLAPEYVGPRAINRDMIQNVLVKTRL